jgi:hypothetical protein
VSPREKQILTICFRDLKPLIHKRQVIVDIPIAFFACCGFCFDDYTEFIEGFFWIVFFEC